jgi:hypothetical protein
MAFRHGKNAALTINSGALAAFLTNADFSTDLDTADTTTWGATWKSAVAGIPGGKIDFSGNYDPTATTGPGAILFPLLTAGTAVTALWYPGGNVSGQSLYTITSGVIVTAYSESSPVGGVVTFKGSVLIVVLPVRTVIGA